MYDVVIIGAGPAGLTAAIYASRRALNTLVLSSDIGGQVTKTFDIENYPGFDNISGAELALKFKSQAEKFGAKVTMEEVSKIIPHDGQFEIKTSTGKYETQSVILAFGKKPRELGVPGEDKFKGRGVTYCATCDAPFFKNKTVVVVGGGNSALDAAVLSSKLASKVYVVQKFSKFNGEQYLIDKVSDAKNIEVIFDNEIEKIEGEKTVNSVTLRSGRKIETSGVMVEIGYFVDRSLAEKLVKLDNNNQVVVDEHQATSVPGIFAAGDLTPTPYKQIVISAGEGAKAALAVFDYLQKQKGKRGIVADWH
ncbi:MAG: FAD-dependent oxidoreductase [Patescibacteria group bacterium]|jgi:thioredoxin reductase (NADPH)